MVRRITDKLTPSILYKYRNWNDHYHQRLITHQEIFLSKPSDFNDPFDGNIPVRWDLMTYKDCFEKNFELLNIKFKNEDQQLVRESAKKVTDEKKFWHPDLLVRERPEQLEKWNSIIGLYSLSSVPNNILMWSHYSLNHTGFVIGFNSDSLINDYDFDYIEPINYQPEYPIISGLDDSTVQFHKKFFYKSEMWNYEKEWRISKNHISNRKTRLSHDAFNHIIIGCCASHSQTKTIVQKCIKHFGASFPIFKAIKNEDNFGLNIIEYK